VITFSEPIDPTTAIATANYSLSGSVTVSDAAVVSADPAQVVLTTSPQVLGTLYVLTVNAVKDHFGNAIAANSTKSFLSAILIDGLFTDWQGMTPLYSGPSGSPDATDFKDIYMFNDAKYLYMRVTTWAPTILQIWYNNFFFDTDNDFTTGLTSWGGSEMLIQGGSGFQEKNGGFNEGPVTNVDWVCEPAGEGTDFEVRISLAATYESDGKPVFTTNVVNFVFDAENTSYQSVNRAPAEGTLSYTLVESQEPPGPLSIGYQGNQLQISWDGVATLQACDSLSTQTWTNVPSATSPYPVNTSAAKQLFYGLTR
jgi:hypothetical protein